MPNVFDTGNTGFMLLATSLVMLMTPGLAFFYGGLVGRKNVLAIMIQSFVSMGWTTVIWCVCGYSLCFSGGARRSHRQPGQRLLPRHQPTWRLRRSTASIPLLVFIAYQMMFAIITPALITGAFANRVRFPAYMIFLTLWLLLRVFPVRAHGLGRRPAGASGACWTSPAASWSTPSPVRGAGLGLLRRPAQGRGPRAAQRAAGGAGHRPALVRLVRVQRRQRTAGGRGDRAGVPEHRHGGVVRGDRVAAAGLDLREEAEVRGAADRRGRRPGDDHARAPATSTSTAAVIIGTLACVVCYFAVGLKNRLQVGRCAGRLGRARRRRRAGYDLPRHLRRHVA